MRDTSAFFTCGPFASASIGVYDFASKSYYSYLFQEALSQQAEMREQLAILPPAEEEEIQHKQSQIDYLEAILQLQLTLAEDPEVES